MSLLALVSDLAEPDTAAESKAAEKTSFSAVAGIATITYTAGLLAGPAIGLLGSAVSLPFAFGLVALLTAGIGLGAGALRDKTVPA